MGRAVKQDDSKMGRAIKQDDSKMGRAIKQKFEWGGPQNKSSSGEGRKAKVQAGRAVKLRFQIFCAARKYSPSTKYSYSHVCGI